MSDRSSSEITAKIRAAIKAKLMELGAYVDDELPDYIMVMIANKKSKQQMTEDLNLFLSKNAVLFTEWLHGVLDRLQSLSRTSSTSAGATSSSSSVVQAVSQSISAGAASKEKSRKLSPPPPKRKSPSPTTRKRKSSPTTYHHHSHRGEDEKRSIDHRKRTNSSSKRGRYSSGGGSDDDHSNGPNDSNDGMRRKKQAISTTKDIVEKKEQDRRSESEKNDDRKRGASSSIGSKSTDQNRITKKPVEKSPSVVDDEDVLIVGGDEDEGDEFSSKVKPISANRSSRLDQHHNQQRTVAVVDKVAPSQTTRSPPIASGSTVSKKPIEFPSPDVSSSNVRRRHVGTVRPMKRRTPSPSEAASRKRRSMIGQVIHRPEIDDLHEEYDPSRPQLGLSVSTSVSAAAVPSIPSTVHVTERKYTVPREMQPKPSIFLRALNEANRSVKVGQRRGEERSGGSSTAGGTTRTITTRDVVVAQKDQHGAEEMEEEDSRPITRRVQLRESDESAARKQPDPTIAVDHDIVVIESPSINASQQQQQRKDEPMPPQQQIKPRFVVTMTGIDKKYERYISSNGGQQEADKIGEDFYDGDDDVLIVDGDDDSDGLDDMVKPMVNRPNQGPMPAIQIVNPVKISLDDDEDDDDHETMKSEDTVRISSKPSIISDSMMSDWPQISDDMGGGTGGGNIGRFVQQQTSMESSGMKSMERCKFWPNCTLGETCHYLHPTLNCKNFPQCRYGDKCLFVHPPCKYDGFCKNPRCPFAHGQPSTTIQPPRFAGFEGPSTSFVPCKFGGRCSNSTCTFRHPQTACMYGSSCTKPTCAFSHRPSPQQHLMMQQRPTIPSSIKGDVGKFRWTATSTRNSESAPKGSGKSTNSETVA